MPKTPITYLYLDTEFTSLTQRAHLLSLALVADSGEWFYGELTDYPKTTITPWIKENVLDNFCLTEKNQPQLSGKHWLLKENRENIAIALQQFIAQFNAVKIWADHVAYDWVLFCELFDGAMHLPSTVHYMPLDLPTVLHLKGIDPDIKRLQLVGESIIPTFPKMARNRHHALYDACMLRACVEKVFSKNQEKI